VKRRPGDGKRRALGALFVAAECAVLGVALIEERTCGQLAELAQVAGDGFADDLGGVIVVVAGGGGGGKKKTEEVAAKGTGGSADPATAPITVIVGGWSAAARSAMVSQNYADQLYRAEVPKEFKTEEQAYAFCDALSDKAQPIQEAAIAKFSYCLERSTTFQFFNEFSRLCEDELQQREPDKYPSTDEVFGVGQYTASRPDRVDVQVDLEGEKRKDKIADKPAEAKPEEKNPEEAKEEDDGGEDAE